MSRRVLFYLLFSASFLVLTPLLAHSHGGGLDAYGCHNDRKHGGYHCHRGQLAGKSFASKQDMLGTLDSPATPAPQKPEAKTVLMGPTSESSERACIREDRTKQVMCGEVVQ
jgi:hypothetical protein